MTKGIQLVKKTNIYSYNEFTLNASLHLKKTKKLISIIKINNFYYYSETNTDKNPQFTEPKKLELNNLDIKKYLVVFPEELKNDDFLKNIDKKKVCIAKFDLKNVDILIEKNLLENKLIKPLYLS